MIYILLFFFISYIMAATSYTFEAVINKNTINEYPYLVAPAFFCCILICWFYVPFDVGMKFYKKLNDTKN